MNLSEYRREYTAYCSALERERYQYHSGLTPQQDFAPIWERYADLWTREAIEDIERIWRETPDHFETERAAIKKLADAARNNFIESRAREMMNELEQCEASERFEWEGKRIGAREAQEIIANEHNMERRRELAARWRDSIRSCNDLRAVRLESMDDSSRLLGFDNYRKLQEGISGTDYEKLSVQADAFLERTSSVYMAHLMQWAAQEFPLPASNSLEYADALFFKRMARFDLAFSSRNLKATYSAVMSGFGVHVAKQSNLYVNDEARPLKKPHSVCFVIKAPDDVRLVLGAGQGTSYFRCFFHEAGLAQHYAWASRDLSARYPEFIHTPDSATHEGHGFLFDYLFHDALWLSEHRGVRMTEAQEMARSFALRDLHDVRRNCAQLRHAINLHTSSGPRSEQLAENYAASHHEATGFSYSSSMYLVHGSNGFHAATVLRARLFAAALIDYLRAKHGGRWWATRAAGDELIDIWNTASRYSVEELAKLTGAGNLDFDLLAETLISALEDE